MRMLLGGIVVVALALVFAPAVGAEVRYAATNGGGFECTESAPCSLEDAIEEAFWGDEVIVLAGTYPVPSSIENLSPIAIHGDFGGPMPRLVGSTESEEAPIQLNFSGTSIEYLDITNAGEPRSAALFCTDEHTVNRVRVTAFGEQAMGIATFGGCTVHNSLIVAEGEGVQAINSTGRTIDPPALFNNVTAIARGEDSEGLLVTYYADPEVAGSYSMSVRNSILRGAGSDINPSVGGSGPGRVDIGNSNFATVGTAGGTVIDSGGNQSAPPQFVNAAAGDFAETAASPTIDAGLAETGGGPLDFAGNPRVLGGKIDIGAFEFVPPAQQPLPSPLPLLTPTPPTPPPSPSITSLSVAPGAFRATNAGGAVISARKKPKGPVGAQVAYDLSAAATVTFTVARKGVGRNVGGTCVKQTKANKVKRKCALLKPVPGSFTHTGAAGANAFKFSGRLGSRPLPAGSYVLSATAGESSRTASFKIVK